MIGVLVVLHILQFCLFLLFDGGLDLFRCLDLNDHQLARHFRAHGIEHHREQFESFAFVLLLWIFLCVAAQMNSLAQMIERREVFAPVAVQEIQHDGPLVIAHFLGILHDGEFILVIFVGRLDDAGTQLLLVEVFVLVEPVLERKPQSKLSGERRLQAGNIPLFGNAAWRNVGRNYCVDRTFAHRTNRVGNVCCFQQFIALLVDHLALIVRDIVVLEQLLADVEVARFHFPLRVLDGPRNPGVFDRFALGHLQPVHDGRHAIRGKYAQQRIFQGQIKAAGAWVPLAPGPAP